MMGKENEASSEAYSELCQRFKMELFVSIVNGLQSITIFAKLSILEVCQGSE